MVRVVFDLANLVMYSVTPVRHDEHFNDCDWLIISCFSRLASIIPASQHVRFLPGV